MSDLFWPPGFLIFFIAYLASVSHDQNFEPNLHFTHRKVPQHLEKFASQRKKVSKKLVLIHPLPLGLDMSDLFYFFYLVPYGPGWTQTLLLFYVWFVLLFQITGLIMTILTSENRCKHKPAAATWIFTKISCSFMDKFLSFSCLSDS